MDTYTEIQTDYIRLNGAWDQSLDHLDHLAGLSSVAFENDQTQAILTGALTPIAQIHAVPVEPSMEGVRELFSRVWKTIRAIIESIWKNIQRFWRWLTNQSDTYEDATQEIESTVKSLDGETIKRIEGPDKSSGRGKEKDQASDKMAARAEALNEANEIIDEHHIETSNHMAEAEDAIRLVTDNESQISDKAARELVENLQKTRWHYNQKLKDQFINTPGAKLIESRTESGRVRTIIRVKSFEQGSALFLTVIEIKDTQQIDDLELKIGPDEPSKVQSLTETTAPNAFGIMECAVRYRSVARGLKEVSKKSGEEDIAYTEKFIQSFDQLVRQLDRRKTVPPELVKTLRKELAQANRLVRQYLSPSRSLASEKAKTLSADIKYLQSILKRYKA